MKVHRIENIRKTKDLLNWLRSQILTVSEKELLPPLLSLEKFCNVKVKDPNVYFNVLISTKGIYIPDIKRILISARMAVVRLK